MFNSKNIFIEEFSEISKRAARLQLCGFAYYLYLTKAEAPLIDKDALAFMIRKPPNTINWDKLKKKITHPYLSKEYETDKTVIRKIKKEYFAFIWSKNGHSVALLYKNEPIAFIIEEEKIGFSKATNKSSPIVNMWNEDKFHKKFNLTTAST